MGPAADAAACCAICRLARCQAWLYDPQAEDGNTCFLKHWTDHIQTAPAKNPDVVYGFGPAADCVSIASHLCDSVDSCQGAHLWTYVVFFFNPVFFYAKPLG
jgi:hypothetical protein